MNLDTMEMRDDQEVNVLDHILGPSEVQDDFAMDNPNVHHSDDESQEVVNAPKTKRKQATKHSSDQNASSSSKKSRRSVEQKKSSSSSSKKTKSHSSVALTETTKPKKSSRDNRAPVEDENNYNHILKMRRELAQHNEAVKHTLSRLTALEKEFSKRSSDALQNRTEIDFPQSAELEALRNDMRKFEEMGQAQMAQMAQIRRRNSGSDDTGGHEESGELDDASDAAAIVDVHARPSEEFEAGGEVAGDGAESLHLDSSDNAGQADSGDEGESAIGTVGAGSKRAISPIEWDRKSEDEEDAAVQLDSKNGTPVNPKEASKNDKDIDIDLILEPVRELSPQPIKRVRRDEYSAAPATFSSGYEAQAVSPPPRQPPSLAHLFKETRYFMIKSNNYENVSLAKAKKVWSTPHGNEARLNQAYYENRNVLLIFSVKESGKFQGYARLAGPSDHRGPRIHWSLPPNMNPRMLSGVFPLDWISRKDLSFAKTQHLHNAWNENKPVKIGRDGQEIEPVCGEALCRSFPVDDNCDLDDIVHKSRSAARRRQRTGPSASSAAMTGSSAATAAAVAAAASYNAAARARVGDDRRAFPINPYRGRRRDYDDRQSVGWGSSAASAAAVAAAAANVASGGYRDHHSNSRSDHHRGPAQRIRSRSPGASASGHHHTSSSTGSVYRGVNRDLLLNGDYQDYLRHQSVRRGYQYYNYPGYGSSAGLSYDTSAYQAAQAATDSYSEKDQKYEQRVSEFLKGIVHREKESSRRRRSRSRTPTRMRGGMSGPRTPSPRSRSRSRDRR